MFNTHTHTHTYTYEYAFQTLPKYGRVLRVRSHTHTHMPMFARTHKVTRECVHATHPGQHAMEGGGTTVLERMFDKRDRATFLRGCECVCVRARACVCVKNNPIDSETCEAIKYFVVW